MRLFEYKKELENVKGIKCTHDLLDSLVNFVIISLLHPLRL